MTLTEAAALLYDEYREGRFPMAETADDPFLIVTPHLRSLLPIRDLHIPRRLLRTVQSAPFEIRVDTAFPAVIAACAAARDERPETWINPDIMILFEELHRMGHAHSVECWQGDMLVGGLYGLAVGGVFCGESMFSHVSNASKVALVHLCARLFAGNFALLDAQFHNPHLDQFGIYSISQKTYTDLLQSERDRACRFEQAETPAGLLEAYLQNREENKAVIRNTRPRTGRSEKGEEPERGGD